MRDIKFRMWSESRGKMLSWKDLQKLHVHTVFNMMQPECPLMQYTGLKDKNGVEIYERDIVTVRDYDDGDYYMIGAVKYGVNGYPAFDVYDKNGGVYSDEYNTLSNDNLCFEVVGNIHENPELV